jgi:membrane-associated protein
VLLAGYALARQITKIIPPEKIDTYLLPVIVVIVLLSAMPIFIEVVRTRRARRRAVVAESAASPDPRP